MKKGDWVVCLDDRCSEFVKGGKYLVQDVERGRSNSWVTINGSKGWAIERFKVVDHDTIFQPEFSLQELERAQALIEAMK